MYIVIFYSAMNDEELFESTFSDFNSAHCFAQSHKTWLNYYEIIKD